MNNKKLGNSFESELCEILSENGFWVHLLNANRAGQPADIIAVRNNVSYLIDAKVCSEGKFPLSRIEENQDLAMQLWYECGNGDGWFALKLGNYIYMWSYLALKHYKDISSTLSTEEIIDLGIPLEKWVKKCK